MNPLVTNCLASVHYGKQILADVEDAKMAERPMGLNPPAWLLMHLATAADYAATMFGGAAVCPADWNERSDTKKPVSDNRADYPSKDELLKYFESSLCECCRPASQSNARAIGLATETGIL